MYEDWGSVQEKKGDQDKATADHDKAIGLDRKMPRRITAVAGPTRATATGTRRLPTLAMLFGSIQN